MKVYDPNSDMKICCHISFDILNSNLRSDCRDLIHLRYIYSKVEKTVNDFFFIDHGHDLSILRYIFRYEEIHIVPLMKTFPH